MQGEYCIVRVQWVPVSWESLTVESEYFMVARGISRHCKKQAISLILKTHNPGDR